MHKSNLRLLHLLNDGGQAHAKEALLYVRVNHHMECFFSKCFIVETRPLCEDLRVAFSLVGSTAPTIVRNESN